MSKLVKSNNHGEEAGTEHAPVSIPAPGSDADFRETSDLDPPAQDVQNPT